MRQMHRLDIYSNRAAWIITMIHFLNHTMVQCLNQHSLKQANCLQAVTSASPGQLEGCRPSTAPFSQNICCFLSFTVSKTFQRVLALIYIWETFWEPQHSSARNISVDQTQRHQVGIFAGEKKKHRRCFHPPFPLAGNICANKSRPWPTFSTSQCFLLSKDALSRWFRTFGIKDGRPSNVIFQGWRL